MNKKFLNAVLFSSALVTATGAFVSCKDYDDDINDLQVQIDKKASVEDLKSQLAALESSINDAKQTLASTKQTAEDAKAAAAKAEAEAKAAGDAAAAAKAAADKAAAEVEIKAAEAKEAAVKAAEEKVNALKAEVEKSMNASLEEIKKIAADIDKVTAEVVAIVGHRLSTLALIPTYHVNGVQAIKITTLKYDPQVYQAGTTAHPGGPTDANHPIRPVLDHKSNGKPSVYLATEKNEAYFHVSPNMGVRNQDIEMPSFDCIVSENETRGVAVTNNKPVQPTGYNIDKDVMTVYFKKTVTTGLNSTTAAHPASGSEKFYMASLKAPIAEANLTAAEKKAGAPVSVNSEYYRLDETYKIPYLANTRTNFTKLMTGEFADETQVDAKGSFYVHYHDSLCAYDSKVNELVDVLAQYDQPLDLKKLVTVCAADDLKNHSKHEDWTKKYKEYGLSFRFTLAKAAYNTLGGPEGNSNKTDQQKFAQIDNAANGIMTSRVYTINGGSATAVGREPIVRVELRDTVNNNLVAQRYIKIKWVKTVGETPLSVNFKDALYVCGDYEGRIGTEEMNVNIYDKVKEGGMTKKEFHAIYTEAGFDGVKGKGEGIVKLIKNSESDVDSYNLVWTLTHAEIVKKYPNWDQQERMEFTKVCTWTDPTKANSTLVITLKRVLYKPVFKLWGYDGRYWKHDDTYTTFNVNPVVYEATDWNPGWGETPDHKNAPTCNIYTDLLNGFLDDNGKKPSYAASGAVYYLDNAFAGKNLYYSALAKGPKGLNRATNKYAAYSDEGVRFIFDEAKLKTDAYKYPYFNVATGKTTDMKATLSPDKTKLYINGELAATINNYVDNKCSDPANETKNDKTYHIVLEEASWDHAPFAGPKPTEAAKALIGKNVPIKMMADICYDDDADGLLQAAHTATIKAYDAFIIEPLTIVVGKTDNFTDATVGGSTIDVSKAFTYTCWNADATGKFYTAKKNGDPLQQALFKFYECVEGEWMTKQITTNLKLDDKGNLVPTDGVTNGPLPSSTTVTYDSAKEELTYNNHSGTPVNWNYTMYIPVKFGYKWKTLTKTFTVQVNKNAGTPAE